MRGPDIAPVQESVTQPKRLVKDAVIDWPEEAQRRQMLGLLDSPGFQGHALVRQMGDRLACYATARVCQDFEEPLLVDEKSLQVTVPPTFVVPVAPFVILPVLQDLWMVHFDMLVHHDHSITTVR